MKCLFCGGELRKSKANLVNCRICGIVPNPKKLDLGSDEIEILREIGVAKASKLVADYGIKGLEYILKYESFRRKRMYSEIKMLQIPRGMNRKIADRILSSLFGCISPSEMVIAQFLRVCCDTGIPAEKVSKGMEMLYGIARKRTVKLADAAAVYYIISGKIQATSARMFGVTEVALRYTLRKLRSEGYAENL
jgi:hypothetical protein